jgi:hypothetical protein
MRRPGQVSTSRTTSPARRNRKYQGDYNAAAELAEESGYSRQHGRSAALLFAIAGLGVGTVSLGGTDGVGRRSGGVRSPWR